MLRPVNHVMVLAVLFASSSSAVGDAGADLAAGRAALAAGDLDKALGLLKPAAQLLPASVEAQEALGQAYIRLGMTDEAARCYQAVLRLSPRHEQARRIVEALAGQRATFRQKLAAAEAMMDLQAYPHAIRLLETLLAAPAEAAERLDGRLLLAECKLWSNSLPEALAEATPLAKEAPATAPAQAAQARAIAALALLGVACQSGYSRTQALQAAELIKDLPQLPPPWNARVQIVSLWIERDRDPDRGPQTSPRLIGPMAALPEGAYRNYLLERLTAFYANLAGRLLARGDPAGAMAVLWPMVSAAPAPGPEALLKPLPVKGGWLGGGVVARQCRASVADALCGLARAELAAQAEPKLLGYWLAGQVLQADDTLGPQIDRLLALAGELGNVAARAGKLPHADEVQLGLLLAFAGEVTEESARLQIVQMIGGYLARRRAAGELEPALGRLVKVQAPPAAGPGAPGAAPKVELVAGLATWSAGGASRQLLLALGAAYEGLGEKAFRQAAGVLAGANSRLNRFDEVALVLFARAAVAQCGDAEALAAARKIIDRYAAADRWAAAEAALAIFYAAQPPDEAAWAAVALKVRQAAAEEDRLLAAHRRLPEKLSPILLEALAAAGKTIGPTPESPERRRAASLAQPLIVRYRHLDRGDLAEAVIAALAGAMPDWAIWARADLLEHQAAGVIARLAQAFDGGAKLALHPLHAAELKLLDQLIAQHPLSPYVPSAVGRVMQISGTYRSYKAFDTAAGVLADFAKAHAGTPAAEQARFAAAQVAVARAQAAFEKRADKEKAPEKLSDEYAAAIAALADFIKAHPAGPYAPAASEAIFQIAAAHGQVGAWPVARDVLKRFSAALPDFKDAPLLRFLEAATYLGELDRGHGLGLFSLPTPPRRGLPAGDEYGLALLDGKPGDTSARRPHGGPGNGRPGGKGKDLDQRDLEPADTYRTPAPAPSATPPPAEEPSASDLALASIRSAEQQRLAGIARMGQAAQQGQRQQRASGQVPVVLPGGPVLSEAEMKRQDAAAEAAYAILLALVKDPALLGEPLPERARGEILWLPDFFRGQGRWDRAAAVAEKYLADNPAEPATLAMSLRAIEDLIAWAGHVQPTDRIDQAWVDQRHLRYEQARARLAEFVRRHAGEKDWIHRARLISAESYQLQAEKVAGVSAVRAGGLLVRSAEELLAISADAPDHPLAATGQVPRRLWDLAGRIQALRQHQQAVHVLSRLPVRFPTDPLAAEAVLRMGELYAANLNAPLRAVETFQEYLSLTGDNPDIRTRIYAIGTTLSGQQRFLEALHVLGVFVDSFPGDPRSPQALRAVGQTHQDNDAWLDAIATYRRILDEYPAADIKPQVLLAIAECQVNLSEWRAARATYQDYLQQPAGAPAPNQPAARQAPAPGGPELARRRLEILKTLDRYQTLLADKQVTRNKDDAQFQIGRIVLEELGYPAKAAAEFRRLIDTYPKSDLADDAQLEIGKALLAQNKPEAARKELLKVPAEYPNSPLADNALFLVGQSYEQQAQRLAAASAREVRGKLLLGGQRLAYETFQEGQRQSKEQSAIRRDELRKGGKGDQIALDEANEAARYNVMSSAGIELNVRQAEVQAETESALQVASRQDRINEAYRQAVAAYTQLAADYPLGDTTGASLEQMARIYEVHLKDPARAMATYQRIVQLFPGTPVAENAALKVARFHEQQGKYDLAVTAYRDFIRTYPASSHVADAQYALAEALEQLGRWVEAMDAYQTFRDKFTSHPKAPKALEQIQWIKAYRK